MGILWTILLTLPSQLAIFPQSPQSPTPTPIPAAESKVYDLEGGITSPQLIPVQLPTAHGEACKNHQRGKVVLDVVVNEAGVPEQVYLVNALGNDLDRLALLTLEVDRFHPAIRDGKAVSVRESAEVSIESCIEVKTDDSGKQVQMLRLTSQPLQTFNKFRVFPITKTMKDTDWPYPLLTPEAQFSAEARQKGINAVCIVNLTVDAHGMPQNLKIVRPAGYGLDDEALRAIMKYRFRPALKNGDAVSKSMTIEVRFRQ